MPPLPARVLAAVFSLAAALPAGAQDSPAPHAVPKEHPRVLGSRAQLQALAKQRAEAYKRMVAVARNGAGDEQPHILSAALVCAVEQDAKLGREAIQWALKLVNGPILKGHVPFGHDLFMSALVFDLCYEHWTADERGRFIEYMNKTVEANVESERQVFHNGWYGYKNAGTGIACYAAYHENEKAPGYLKALDLDYRTRAAPALELAGDGGGWAEGYYVNYWIYEWLVFCEAARNCEGLDYYALAPKFYRQRAVAGLFEVYPGKDQYGARRLIPMGDGGGRVFGGDRDGALMVRRILASFYRDDPVHQAVHAYNETTPRVSVNSCPYLDFLWHDATVPKGDLTRFKLSHLSPGPGYVYARSSWDDDATHFFFKCGDRFTAHQHLDVGHFLIYKHEELAGDGGHYDGFGSPHDVNYHLRSIAHSTILVLDPAETWPKIRAGNVTGNDGGQAHAFPSQNGGVGDADEWRKNQKQYHIAQLLAFEDRGNYLYVAGDCTRAYSPKKLEGFTRQIVFLRPNTFVVFDRVKATNPAFKKTWLLQALKRPEGQALNLVVTNGKGRLFVQTLLPAKAETRLVAAGELYSYGGKNYPPEKDTGPAPECRIEVSPAEPSAADYFLHVLTAADAKTPSVAPATVKQDGSNVVVKLDQAKITFTTTQVGGTIEVGGPARPLADKVVGDPSEKDEKPVKRLPIF